jgi:adenylate cyclase
MAILAADAVGYSRLMSVDDRATVVALESARGVFRSHTLANDGRVIDTAGDSVLAVFETAAGAVTAALEAQQEFSAASSALPEDRRMRFRIGVHLGDVIEKADGTVYGDGVNIAARLQGLAEPRGITVSSSIRSAVEARSAPRSMTWASRPSRTSPTQCGRTRSGARKRRSPPPRESMSPRRCRGSAAGRRLRSAVRQPVGRPGAGIFRRRARRGHSHPAGNVALGAGDRAQLELHLQGSAVDVRSGGARAWRALRARRQRAQGRRPVRVTGQLIDTETGHHVWAERYDRVLEDLFAIQDELH